jgi:hypothetical protein
MSNFSNNFSELYLLTNQNIKFIDEVNKRSFELIPMKVKDMMFNADLLWLLSFLSEDIQKYKDMIPGQEIKTHYEFLQILCLLTEANLETKQLVEKFINAFQIIIPDINLNGKLIRIQDFILTPELFNDIDIVIFKILEKERIKVEAEDDEIEKRLKEQKLKVQKIKQNSRKKDSLKFDDLFAAILYEFPQYKLEDIFELNIYTFYYLFKYVGRIANYEVSKIAAGNGLAKKHKYFIEK